MPALHEFAIMDYPPSGDKVYDSYEPYNYSVVTAVDDDILDTIVPKLNMVRFFWHSTDRQEYGLVYYGITLIAPSCANECLEIFKKYGGEMLNELNILFQSAIEQDSYIIHFGI